MRRSSARMRHIKLMARDISEQGLWRLCTRGNVDACVAYKMKLGDSKYASREKKRLRELVAETKRLANRRSR